VPRGHPSCVRAPAWRLVSSDACGMQLSWNLGCQTLSMSKNGRNGRRRIAAIVLAGGAIVVLIATAGDALLERLTKLPLGRGTATITWKGATGLSPTKNSIKGTAGGYQVAATGRVPKTPPSTGTASALPSQYPIADVKGAIGGTGFTLNIVLTLPASLTSSKLQTFGHVTGTFRNQQVAATLTANVNSSSFTFVGTIGSLHIAGHVSQPKQQDNTETARATFNVTK
jgi:hypothetical protein